MKINHHNVFICSVLIKSQMCICLASTNGRDFLLTSVDFWQIYLISYSALVMFGFQNLAPCVNSALSQFVMNGLVNEYDHTEFEISDFSLHE